VTRKTQIAENAEKQYTTTGIYAFSGASMWKNASGTQKTAKNRKVAIFKGCRLIFKSSFFYGGWNGKI